METFFVVLGGVGLFLLGMMIMTDGLKSLAGNSLKQLLSKFTGGTFSSLLSGASITAVIQSSSATSLMTIGFVSAGLLTFTQSVGIIIGANLGSTSTGWIVSAIGFKVSMGALAMPLIGSGAFLRFLSKGRFTAHGMALAGLGMLFLGIDILQNGMSSVTSVFSLQFLGSPSLWQMILLIVLGVVMTVVMQSSSAAFVITLTALAADTITFEQAAAVVIGQNVGTTIKAYIASINSTVPAKRTALAHIWFNLFTGLVAFLLFPWLIPGVLVLGEWMQIKDLAILLSLLNTMMYMIGVLVIVPLLPYFTRFIERLVPERNNQLVKYLDPTVATVPAVAIEAARRTLIKVTKAIARTGSQIFLLKAFTTDMRNQLNEASTALIETRQFLSLIRIESAMSTSIEYRQQVALVHIIDHLERLIKALFEEEGNHYLQGHSKMQEPLLKVQQLFSQIEERLNYENIDDIMVEAEENSQELADLRRTNRKEIFEKTVLQRADVDAAIQDVHTLHWVDRVAYHVWRCIYHIHACSNPEVVAVEDE